MAGAITKKEKAPDKCVFANRCDPTHANPPMTGTKPSQSANVRLRYFRYFAHSCLYKKISFLVFAQYYTRFPPNSAKEWSDSQFLKAAIYIAANLHPFLLLIYPREFAQLLWLIRYPSF